MRERHLVPWAEQRGRRGGERVGRRERLEPWNALQAGMRRRRWAAGGGVLDGVSRWSARATLIITLEYRIIVGNTCARSCSPAQFLARTSEHATGVDGSLVPACLWLSLVLHMAGPLTVTLL